MNNRRIVNGIIAVIGLIIAIGLGYWIMRNIRGDKVSLNQATNNSKEDTPPLLIKHLGLNLEPYDSTTQKAGDFVFTKMALPFQRIWLDYGFFIPASDASPDKKNPQPTFIVPLGTNVHSLVDGVVVEVPKLYSNDYSIQVAKDKKSPFRYETEHVLNPRVKAGDKVTAGQVIAEVSDYDSKNMPGFGLVEIGILKGGDPPEHLCPFLYLDPSIKETTFHNLRSFYQAWNSYRGTKFYDETGYETLGCLTTERIQD